MRDRQQKKKAFLIRCTFALICTIVVASIIIGVGLRCYVTRRRTNCAASTKPSPEEFIAGYTSGDSDDDNYLSQTPNHSPPPYKIQTGARDIISGKNQDNGSDVCSGPNGAVDSTKFTAVHEGSYKAKERIGVISSQSGHNGMNGDMSEGHRGAGEYAADQSMSKDEGTPPYLGAGDRSNNAGADEISSSCGEDSGEPTVDNAGKTNDESDREDLEFDGLDEVDGLDYIPNDVHSNGPNNVHSDASANMHSDASTDVRQGDLCSGNANAKNSSNDDEVVSSEVPENLGLARTIDGGGSAALHSEDNSVLAETLPKPADGDSDRLTNKDAQEDGSRKMPPHHTVKFHTEKDNLNPVQEESSETPLADFGTVDGSKNRLRADDLGALSAPGDDNLRRSGDSTDLERMDDRQNVAVDNERNSELSSAGLARPSELSDTTASSNASLVMELDQDRPAE
jgi:hypothetical protein